MKATLHKCVWLNKENKIAQYSKEEITLSKESNLEFLQDLVHGLIEIYHHEGHDLIFNEEGLLLELPRNPLSDKVGFLLVGTIVEVHGKLK